MAPHSSTLAWKIPWMEEPGGLQSMASLRVGHDWVTSLSLFTFMHWGRKWQPTPVFLPGESQGRGSLVGCHLWGRTESDTTEVTQQQQQCKIGRKRRGDNHKSCHQRDLPGESASISHSVVSNQPKDHTQVFCIAGKFLTICTTRDIPGGPVVKNLCFQYRGFDSWLEN